MGLSDDLKKSIASSIAAMAVEISRLEMVLIMECEGVPCAGVCSVPGNLLLLNLRNLSFTSRIKTLRDKRRETLRVAPRFKKYAPEYLAKTGR